MLTIDVWVALKPATDLLRF